jgi:hypothetical protein
VIVKHETRARENHPYEFTVHGTVSWEVALPGLGRGAELARQKFV